MSEEFSPALPPGDRTALPKEGFRFHCHPGVSCFLKCCHDVVMYLFPYDVIRLKNRLNLSSAEFLHKHARISEGSHPYFPGLMLNMAPEEGAPCPFLQDDGCSVYQDRPSACRTYPLERGVENDGVHDQLKTHYFITHHPYCKGHFEDKNYTLKRWEREQGLYDYNVYNDLWAKVDAFFATNPWRGEGHAGPLQQLAFMVCYNIDGFRQYAKENNVLKQAGLNKNERRKIQKDDGALLQFGFEWLHNYLSKKQIW